MWKHPNMAHSIVAGLTGFIGESGETPISSLAAEVQTGDIVMYSTTSCPYCREAGAWMRRNGFAFTECNMTTDLRCESEFLSYGGTGTPYLVVRGHHMKDGFNSDEFLAALRR
jgi:glutaredoxin